MEFFERWVCVKYDVCCVPETYTLWLGRYIYLGGKILFTGNLKK